MLIMIVFDPLAVLLLIAANMNLKKNEEEKPVVANKTWNDFMKGQPTELVVEPEPVDNHAYLKEPFKHFQNLEPMPHKKEEETVKVDAKNITTIEEPQPIVIDDITGETIPPIGKSPGVETTMEELDEDEGKKKRGFPNRKSKIDSMYVENAELAFRKKENK
jgi:hypothetical protein